MNINGELNRTSVGVATLTDTHHTHEGVDAGASTTMIMAHSRNESSSSLVSPIQSPVSSNTDSGRQSPTSHSPNSCHRHSGTLQRSDTDTSYSSFEASCSSTNDVAATSITDDVAQSAGSTRESFSSPVVGSSSLTVSTIDDHPSMPDRAPLTDVEHAEQTDGKMSNGEVQIENVGPQNPPKSGKGQNEIFKVESLMKMAGDQSWSSEKRLRGIFRGEKRNSIDGFNMYYSKSEFGADPIKMSSLAAETNGKTGKKIPGHGLMNKSSSQSSLVSSTGLQPVDPDTKAISKSIDYISEVGEDIVIFGTDCGPVLGGTSSCSEASHSDQSKDLGSQSSDQFVTPTKEPRFGCSATNGSKATLPADVVVNGASGKSGKIASDRKKKGSWYSVLSPTYKSRSEDFKKIFKEIPNTERLIVDYSCALQKDILVHGRLYISQNWVCFYANIFRWETLLMIRCKDITKVSKERTARVIPNAIQIATKEEKFFFTSFGARDKTYLMLDRVWKSGINDQKLSAQEVWQWIHYSYGEDLGLTSDDEDYIPLTSDEKIQFQTRIQREEKLAQSTDGGTTADITKEPTEDYSIVSDELNLTVPSFTISHDDSSVADNLSLASGEELNFSWADGMVCHDGLNEVPCKLKVPSSDGIAGEAALSTDADDTTEDEEVNCCGQHEHFETVTLDESFPVSVDTMFEFIFTDSLVQKTFMSRRRTTGKPRYCTEKPSKLPCSASHLLGLHRSLLHQFGKLFF